MNHPGETTSMSQPCSSPFSVPGNIFRCCLCYLQHLCIWLLSLCSIFLCCAWAFSFVLSVAFVFSQLQFTELWGTAQFYFLRPLKMIYDLYERIWEGKSQLRYLTYDKKSQGDFGSNSSKTVQRQRDVFMFNDAAAEFSQWDVKDTSECWRERSDVTF